MDKLPFTPAQMKACDYVTKQAVETMMGIGLKPYHCLAVAALLIRYASTPGGEGLSADEVKDLALSLHRLWPNT